MGFDPVLFGIQVTAAMNGRPCREVAKEIGVSSSTLNRITRGGMPDVPNYVAIQGWLARLASTQEPATITSDELRIATGTLEAVANLIERPPLDDVQLEKDAALRTSKAIRVVLAALCTPASPFPREEVALAVHRAIVEWDQMKPLKTAVTEAVEAALLQRSGER